MDEDIRAGHNEGAYRQGVAAGIDSEDQRSIEAALTDRVPSEHRKGYSTCCIWKLSIYTCYVTL